jgi:site-specific DNA-methyltransferase (adenine-specific)
LGTNGSNGSQVEPAVDVALQSAQAATALAPKLEPPEPARASSAKRELRELVREAIVESFYAAHNGFSIDWLLANPHLQYVFHDACRDAGLIGGPADWNRELLRLRKTGGFPKRGTIRKVHIADEQLDNFSFAAEIAWRLATDKFPGASLDEILCDPAKATYFDRAARRFAPGFRTVEYRWAALRLRKASRELVDDVTQFHFVFAKRDFTRFQSFGRLNPSRYQNVPGVYLLRDQWKQPMYVGRTMNLGRRLQQHAVTPQVADVAAQLSLIVGDELPALGYQAAFKEDLVRRYQPLWNVNLAGLQHAQVAMVV